MILLLTGASHTGKTTAAQTILEKQHINYLSIDHLKMGLIRSGQTKLTVEDDKKDLSKKHDNFYWLGQINKASIIINTDEGLLDKKYSADFAKALQTVIHNGNLFTGLCDRI